jgi:hypothetical protein
MLKKISYVAYDIESLRFWEWRKPTNQNYEMFEIFTATYINMTALCDAATCSSVDIVRRSKEIMAYHRNILWGL